MELQQFRSEPAGDFSRVASRADQLEATCCYGNLVETEPNLLKRINYLLKNVENAPFCCSKANNCFSNFEIQSSNDTADGVLGKNFQSKITSVLQNL